MSTKTLLTGDDLWKLVADGSRYELCRGELVPMTPVGFRHGRIVIRFGQRLNQYAEEKRLGAVCTEVGFRLSCNPDTVRAPDVAFVAKSRVPTGTLAEKFLDFPPDLAVEVLSPEDRASEVLRKVDEYLAAGVPLVWVLDPATEKVTVYRSLQNIKVLSVQDELDGGEPLPGFRVKVAELFAE